MRHLRVWLLISQPWERTRASAGGRRPVASTLSLLIERRAATFHCPARTVISEP